MRRVLFWLHLGAGVLVGALVIYFSVTGALLAYERPILQAADRHTYTTDANLSTAPRLPLDVLLAHAVASLPAPIAAVTLYKELNLPLELETAAHDVYLVDTHSGSVQGPASPRLRGFFAQVTALHRWFGLGNAHHSAAIAIKGVTVLLLLFQLVSGAVLWVPHHWSASALRTGIVFRRAATSRARNYNWHKVTGFWIGVPLAIIVVTGVIMAYPWANALLFRVTGSPLPVRDGNRAPRRHDPRRDENRLPAQLDQAFTQATSTVTGWRSATLRLSSGASGLSFVVDRSDGGHPEKREQVQVDAKTLQIVRREPFAALSRGQQWRAWVRFAHTGEAGGWWGETLALVTACGATVLSLTGFALSYDRLRRYQRTDKTKRQPAVTV